MCWAMGNAVLLGRFWEHVHMFLLELARIYTRDFGFLLLLVFFFPQPPHKCLLCSAPGCICRLLLGQRRALYDLGRSQSADILPSSVSLAHAKPPGTSVGCFRPGSGKSWALELCPCSPADQAC